MAIRKSVLLCMVVVALASVGATAQQAWFGGQPPLGAQYEHVVFLHLGEQERPGYGE